MLPFPYRFRAFENGEALVYVSVVPYRGDLFRSSAQQLIEKYENDETARENVLELCSK